MGASSSSLHLTVKRKKHSNKPRTPRNDGNQPSSSSSPLTPTHPLTPSSRSPSIASLRMPQSHRRSRSITPTHSSNPLRKGKGDSSMSLVSLFFNKGLQSSSKSSAASSSYSIGGDEKPIKLIAGLESKSKARTRSPSPIPSKSRSHKHSRSMSSSLDDYSGEEGLEPLHPLALFTPGFPALFGVTPSLTTLKRLERQAKRQKESSTNVPSPKKLPPTLQVADDDDELPVDDMTDADSCYIDDDACSSVSSIHFADDPDQTLPKKSQNRASCLSNETGSTLTRLNRESFVLDISAANRVLEHLEGIMEGTQQEQEDDDDVGQNRSTPRGTKNLEKIARMLGETPHQRHQIHHRRHSYSTIPSSIPSPDPSSHVTSLSAESSWSLPHVPVVSPLSLPSATHIPALVTQPPSPALSALSGPTSKLQASQRKRRSSLLWASVDGLAALFKQQPDSNVRKRDPWSSKTFKSPRATPQSPPPVTSAPQVPDLSAHQGPSTPPGLGTVGPHQSDADRHGEQIAEDDSKRYRDSVMTVDSMLSDLHRLPLSLTQVLEDSQSERQSVAFNTAPSTPTLASHGSSSTSASTSSGSGAQSPVSVTSTTPLMLPDPYSHVLLPAVAQIPPPSSPLRSRTDPQRPQPLSSMPSNPYASLRLSSLPVVMPSRVTVMSTTNTGAEMIIDPIDSSYPLVSPIVFATPADADDDGYDHYLDGLPSESPVDAKFKHDTMFENGNIAEDQGADAEERKRQRMMDNDGWRSVRVPLRRKVNGREEQNVTSPMDKDEVYKLDSEKGNQDRRTWVGEWNVDLQDVIQQLRTIR